MARSIKKMQLQQRQQHSLPHRKNITNISNKMQFEYFEHTQLSRAHTRNVMQCAKSAPELTAPIGHLANLFMLLHCCRRIFWTHFNIWINPWNSRGHLSGSFPHNYCSLN